jgi:hypothetical protein
MSLTVLPVLLADLFAEGFELLAELLQRLLRAVFVLHLGERLGTALEVLRRQAEVSHQVLGGLGEFASEPFDLPAGALSLVVLALESLVLALPLPEEVLFGACELSLPLPLEHLFDLPSGLRHATVEFVPVVRLPSPLEGLLEFASLLLGQGLVPAQPFGELAEGVLGRSKFAATEGLGEVVGERPFHLSTDFVQGVTPCVLVFTAGRLQTVLEFGKASPGLLPFEPTGLHVVEEALEVPGQLARRGGAGVAFDLSRKLTKRCQIVGFEHERLGRRRAHRGREHSGDPELRHGHQDQEGEHPDHSAGFVGPPPPERLSGVERPSPNRLHGIIDRGLHPGRPLGGRAGSKRQRRREPVVQGVVPVEDLRGQERGHRSKGCQEGPEQGDERRKAQGAPRLLRREHSQARHQERQDSEGRAPEGELHGPPQGPQRAEPSAGASDDPSVVVEGRRGRHEGTRCGLVCGVGRQTATSLPRSRSERRDGVSGRLRERHEPRARR